MASKVQGTAYLSIDGVSYPTTGDLSATIKNVEKNTVTDSHGVTHYGETNIPSIISGTMTTTSTLDIDKIINGNVDVILVELPNGKSAQISNAIFTGSGEVSPADGTVAVEWQGFGEWV